MLKNRIIPCLDIKDGRTVKGVNFLNIKDAGDPVELAKRYSLEGADELVFLDISASIEKRKTLVEVVEKVAAKINIPFTVGGGINSLEDARSILKAGADKISINSAALKNPKLIRQMAESFGSQCVVVAIDCKYYNDEWHVYSHGGTTATDWTTLDWALITESLGAGEILLTSMDKDGLKTGFNLDLYAKVSSKLKIPIIASGGAGKSEHFKSLFEETQVRAGLAASIFHFGEISIPALKRHLKNQNIPVR